jgi:hypothetical protein
MVHDHALIRIDHQIVLDAGDLEVVLQLVAPVNVASARGDDFDQNDGIGYGQARSFDFITTINDCIRLIGRHVVDNDGRTVRHDVTGQLGPPNAGY